MTPQELESQLTTALTQVIADETVLQQAVAAVQTVVTVPPVDPNFETLQAAVYAYVVAEGGTAPAALAPTAPAEPAAPTAPVADNPVDTPDDTPSA